MPAGTTPASRSDPRACRPAPANPSRVRFDSSARPTTAVTDDFLDRVRGLPDDQLYDELQQRQDEKVMLMEAYILCLEGQPRPGVDKRQLKRDRDHVQSRIAGIKQEIHRRQAGLLPAPRPNEASISTIGSPRCNASREQSVVLAPDSSPLLKSSTRPPGACNAPLPPIPDVKPEPMDLSGSHATSRVYEVVTMPQAAPLSHPAPPTSPASSQPKKRRISRAEDEGVPPLPPPPPPPPPAMSRRSGFRPAQADVSSIAAPVLPAEHSLQPRSMRMASPPAPVPSPRARMSAQQTSLVQAGAAAVPKPRHHSQIHPNLIDSEDDDFFDGLEEEALDALFEEPQAQPDPRRKPLTSKHPPPVPALSPVSQGAKTKARTCLPSTSESGKDTAEPRLNPKRTVAQPGVDRTEHPVDYMRSMRPALAAEVSWVLRNVFRLSNFRPHQLEAIDATLQGKDVFCLMPTGGGKSLCYQLPALVSSGKTRGVTVVISPLLSLINDQVSHLHRLGIPAFNISGDMTQAARRMVFDSLRSPAELEERGQLFYVTPEFVSKSNAARELLAQLLQQGRLARFVIDEAHCVSQWGHDFRPDYKHLGRLRSQYPHVPIMAMTATAPPRVQMDILTVLKVDNAVKFVSSFNRPNLRYEVRRKGKWVLKDMVDFIKTHHDGHCGIIYCLSKRSCEEVAEKLAKEYNLPARHYHAGMSKNDRNMFQSAWQEGQFKIMVATIAFGMGIDKGDVRFVIHHSLPQSVEGFYQETGRAGRDGQVSDCVLYFAPKDITTLRKMIFKAGGGDRHTKAQQLENLDRMVQYCFDSYNCRRQQVLHYFSEDFDPQDCHQTCDNCRRDTGELEDKDMTDDAARILEMIPSMTGNVTLQHCIDVYRGLQSKVIKGRKHHLSKHAGMGKTIPRDVCERLFYAMHSHKALEEYTITNEAGYSAAYIQPGPAKSNILSRKIKIFVTVPKGKGDATVKAGRKKAPLLTTAAGRTIPADGPEPESAGRPYRRLALARQTRTVGGSTSRAMPPIDDVASLPNDESEGSDPEFIPGAEGMRGALARIRACRAGANAGSRALSSRTRSTATTTDAVVDLDPPRRHAVPINANGVQIEDEEADRISTDEDIDLPHGHAMAQSGLDEVEVSDEEDGEEPDDAETDIYHRCLAQLKAVRANAADVEKCSLDKFLPNSVLHAIAANPPETRSRLEEMVGPKRLDPLFQKYRLDILHICREYADAVDEDWRAQTQAIRATLRPPTSPVSTSCRGNAATDQGTSFVFTPQRLPDIKGFAAPKASGRSSGRETSSSSRSRAQPGSPSPHPSSAIGTSRFFDKTNGTTRPFAN